MVPDGAKSPAQNIFRDHDEEGLQALLKPDAGSNPAGGTHLTSANAGLRTGLPIPYLLAHLRRAADSLAACALTAGLTCCRSVVAGRDSAVAAVIGRPCLQQV